MKQIFNLFLIMNKTFFREKQAVFWNFLFPLFLIFIFGSVFGGSGSNNISLSIGISNLDSGEESKMLVEVLKSIPILKISENKDSEQLKEKIKKRKMDYALVIPENFQKGEKDFKPITLLYDPQQISTNQIAFTVFDKMLAEMNKTLTQVKPAFSLLKEPVTGVQKQTRYIDFLVPGVLAMSLLSSALFGIGVVITSEREKGQLRKYAVTPLPRGHYIIGQLLQRLLMAMMQAAVIIIIATLVYKVQFKGNVFVLIFILTVGLLSFAALSYAIAARNKKAETTAAVANVFFLPMMFLSGIYFPVQMMPSYLRPVAKALPLTYLSDSLRMVFAGSVSIQELLVPLLVLSGWFLVCLVIAIKVFVWD